MHKLHLLIMGCSVTLLVSFSSMLTECIKITYDSHDIVYEFVSYWDRKHIKAHMHQCVVGEVIIIILPTVRIKK